MEIARIEPADTARIEECARMMVSSEPWITLRRTFEGAVKTLSDPDKELHAAMSDGTIAGFILLDMRGPLMGYIQSVCVHPGFRDRGVGAEIIAWAEQRIYKESPNVFLFVSSFNPAAQRFYERLGFTVVGRVPGFVVAEHDEILMRKSKGSWRDFNAAS